MQKMILVDATKCTGCRTCELVCSVKNEGIANPARARVQVIKFEEILFEVPMLCQQCADAPCLASCPVSAISRDKDTGVVEINDDRCIKCRTCMSVCPFGAMSFDPVGKKMFKCDQCGGEPACVKFCETQALQFVDVTAVRTRKSWDRAQKLSEIVRYYNPEMSRIDQI